MSSQRTYTKLGDVCKVNSGKGIAAELISPNYSPSLFPCYGGNGIRGYVKTPSHNGVHPIIGRVGALCGNVHLAKGEFYATEHALIFTITDNGVNPEWLSFLLKYKDLSKIAKGVAQPVISASEVMKQELPMPSLSEQQSIVRELDAISDVIAAKNAQLRELDALAQALFYDIFGDPITNPKGWPVKKLGDVAIIRDGSHNPPKGVAVPTEYRMLSSQNIYDNLIDYSKGVRYLSKESYALEHKRTNLKAGDVLLTIVGTIGRSCIVSEMDTNITLQRSVAVLSPKDDILSIYLNRLLFVIGEKLQYESRGVAQKGIYLGQLSKTEIPLPPLDLQQSFAAKIQAIEAQKATLRQSIAEFESLLAQRMDYHFN